MPTFLLLTLNNYAISQNLWVTTYLRAHSVLLFGARYLRTPHVKKMQIT